MRQLDHWARVGRAVSSRHSAARRKLEEAVAGELEVAELSVEDQATVYDNSGLKGPRIVAQMSEDFIVGPRPGRTGHHRRCSRA